MGHPIQIQYKGDTFVELPNKFCQRGVGIVWPFESFLESSMPNLSARYVELKDDFFPKQEIGNKKTKQAFSLKDFDDCGDSDLRVAFELIPPGGLYKDFHLGTPRIFCLNCGSKYDVPREMYNIKHQGKLFPDQQLKDMEYFLIGNNQTQLGILFTLLVLDEFSAPDPRRKNTLEDRINLVASTGVLDGLLGQDEYRPYHWLEKHGHVKKQPVKLHAISNQTVSAYNIKEAGRKYLYGEMGILNRLNQKCADLDNKLGEVIIDFLYERIDQTRKKFNEPRDENTVEEGGFTEFEGIIYKHPTKRVMIDHIPKRNVDKILIRQKENFRREFGFAKAEIRQLA